MNHHLHMKKVYKLLNLEDVTVDTSLDKQVWKLGEYVSGLVRVRGGSKDQQVGHLYMYLMTEFNDIPDLPLSKKPVSIGKFTAAEPFLLHKEEEICFPFSFQLPLHTPVSLGSARIWIYTGLDLDESLDATDKDYFDVEYSPLQQSIIDAIESLEWEKRRIRCIPVEGETLPFIQSYIFSPNHSDHSLPLEHLEIIFRHVELERIKVTFRLVNDEKSTILFEKVEIIEHADQVIPFLTKYL